MANKNQSYTPIDKGQFTLETIEREQRFQQNRAHGFEREYEVYRDHWNNHPKNKYISEYPLHVDLELASICNLRCPMCYTISPEFRTKVNATLMDFDLFTKIVDECAEGGVYSIRLSFRGESFLHKDILKCLKYAKKKGIKEVSTLTNGLKLDEQMFTEMMYAGLDWLTISFDGIGKVYEDIRRPAKYDRAVEKIKNYKTIKESAGRVKPVIKVQSILPAIERDPKAFYDVFKDIVDLVSANPLIDFLESTKNSPKVENFSCPQIYQRLVVGADGLCMMCTNDESGKHIVGDANQSTIFQIWHGQEMQRIRETHKKHCGPKELEACAECYLPLQTFEEEIAVGDRTVIGDKYVSGKTEVNQLSTPNKFKRADLKV
ncbi:radical SAM/SPASM domain-containing protein [Alphaproteobacteria bacterium]|nr:radical SAM/SPASM domain-containing protein [Alphaproteobacteria bacterium]